MSVQLARLHVRREGGVVTAEIVGEIDVSNASELLGALLMHLREHAVGLVLDLAGLTYLDSAGINVVYGLRERLRVRGLKLRLVVPADAAIMDVLRLTGVTEAIPVDATAADAEREILA